MIFEPYRLDGDFIIDTGKYIKDGFVETKFEGIIEKIKFSNQQIGNGRTFFVGLNNKLKEGDFRNRFLENLIFCQIHK